MTVNNFDQDFIDFFNPETSKEARKNFRCRLCDLYLNHPDVFSKGYSGNKRLGISYFPEKEEEAKNILRKVYIPEMKVSKYNVKNTYVSKSGEVKTYNYTATYVLRRKPTSVSEQLKDVISSEEARKILTSKDMPVYLKMEKLKSLPDFPKGITNNQLQQFIYRYLRN